MQREDDASFRSAGDLRKAVRIGMHRFQLRNCHAALDEQCADLEIKVVAIPQTENIKNIRMDDFQ